MVESSTAETVGAVMGVVTFVAAAVGGIVALVQKIAAHEARISTAEEDLDHTAEVLERTTLIVAKLEERTRNI